MILFLFLTASPASLPTDSRTYAIAKKPSELVLDHAAVLTLAAHIEKDIHADLAKVTDKAQLKTLYRALASFAWYRGDAAGARAHIAKVGELEDKPAEKTMNGVNMLSILDATPGPDFHQSLRTALTTRLRAMPWDVVQASVKQHKAQAEMLSRELVLRSAEANLDKAAVGGTLSQPLAMAVVGAAIALEKLVPVKDELVAAYGAVIDAHPADGKLR